MTQQFDTSPDMGQGVVHGILMQPGCVSGIAAGEHKEAAETDVKKCKSHFRIGGKQITQIDANI